MIPEHFRTHWLIYVFAALFYCGPGEDAVAHVFCTKPTPPICLNTLYTFDNNELIAECRRKMKEYIDFSSRYVSCLEDDRDVSIRETNEAIKKFNCRMEKNAICY